LQEFGIGRGQTLIERIGADFLKLYPRKSAQSVFIRVLFLILFEKALSKLIEMIRVETVAEAAHEDINLIYTFCYAKDSDDAHVAKITETVESNGGEICFVLLTCERGELERRVLTESRKQFGKANNLEILNEILDKYDLTSPVPERASLQIDNTNLSPAAAARSIIKHYKLELVAPENYS